MSISKPFIIMLFIVFVILLVAAPISGADTANGYNLVVLQTSGDTALFHNGWYYTLSDTPFSVIITALNSSGQPIDGYTGDKYLDWEWLSGDTVNTATGNVAGTAADGYYTFTGGTCLVPGFRIVVERDSVMITVKDSASTTVGTLRVVGNDGTGPVMMNGWTSDRDGDGYLDLVTVCFNEIIYEDLYHTSRIGFSVNGGYNSFTVDSINVQGPKRQVELYCSNSGTDLASLSERPQQDTRYQVSVSYDGGGAIVDKNFNRALPRTIVVNDSAGPAISKVIYDNKDNDYINDDVMLVVLSEPVASASWEGKDPDELFTFDGTGQFGINATVTVYGDLVYINMGFGAAPLPMQTSLRLIPGGFTDLVGIPVPANNMSMYIISGVAGISTDKILLSTEYNGFSVGPNPFINTLWVWTGGNQAASAVFTLCNNMGRTIFTRSVNELGCSPLCIGNSENPRMEAVYYDIRVDNRVVRQGILTQKR